MSARSYSTRPRATSATRGRWHPCHGSRVATIAVALAAWASASAPATASACGGCFVRSSESTVVTDHRMAFSISTTQTVLWDQIRYSGDPSEFAWVLPVVPGTKLELSHDEWFAALDAVSQPIVYGPPPASSGTGSGCACGSNAASSFAGASDENGTVQVVSEQVVGPYETVTLRSANGDSLRSWLTQHGYDVPVSIGPTIDAYASEGFDFIALRLVPGQGVRAMKPVRVVTAGADTSLPLRMVAAGVGANVDVTLYVLGEGRYEPQNFPVTTIDDGTLIWDSSKNQSNYQAVSEAAMAAQNGRTWLTEFADHPTICSTAPTYSGATCGSNAAGSIPLDRAYFQQCSATSHAFSLNEAPAIDGGDDAASDASDDAIGDAATDANAEDAGDDAAIDAGSDAESSDAGVDAASPFTCDPTECCSFDDLDVALLGLHVTDLWVTRLRAKLPVGALGEGDLVLRASAAQTSVSNIHFTSSAVPASVSAVPIANSSCAVSAPDRSSWWALGGALAVFAASFVRRRRSR